MSDNKKIQDTENTNEWINWIEEAIIKEHLNYYEYDHFKDVQEIGTGGFGKVYCASWKKSRKQFALKSFFDINNVTMKEIVCEVIYLYNTIFFRLFFFIDLLYIIFISIYLVKNST
jgi:hypothetical protein